jgi:hypothetical protein
MKEFIVKYIFTAGEPERAESVTAADYTEAYLKVIFDNDINIIITSVREI